MLNRILRKFKSISLRLGMKTFDQFKNIKPFDRLDSNIIEQNRKMLEPYYKEYVRDISRADMAASIELAAFMFSICKLNNYTKLLDMGSGLSSFVFRLYAKETPGVKVYSVDDDAAWLEKTRAFLRLHQLDTQNLFTLDQFLTSKESGFDCILHDLNFVEVRINYVDHLIKLIDKDGLLVLDDVHKPDYMYAALKVLSKTKAKVYTLKPVTIDGYGRFAMGVTKD